MMFLERAAFYQAIRSDQTKEFWGPCGLVVQDIFAQNPSMSPFEKLDEIKVVSVSRSTVISHWEKNKIHKRGCNT